MSLLPEWTAVKVAIRKLADLPDLLTFLEGGSSVQGVTVNTGDRFLVFDEPFGDQNGIFELYTGGGGPDYRRPTDADDEDDFEAQGKQVRVLGGDYDGLWYYKNSEFPGLSDPYDPGANVPLVFQRGYVPDQYINPFAVALGIPPIPAALVAADDNRAPVAKSVAVAAVAPGDQFGFGPADLGGGYDNREPMPAFFNTPQKLTINGDPVTIGGEALAIRL